MRDRYGIPFLPLDDEGDYEALPPALHSLCCALSQQGPIAYLEAAYWGGMGEQASTVFREGSAAGKPDIGKGAINRALRMLGVVANVGLDEFDTVGLGRYRDTDKWSG